MSDQKLQPGTCLIDATGIKIVALTNEQISKFSKVRPGFALAIECLIHLKPDLVERAGISPSMIQKATELMATHERCDDVLPATEKLVELLHETRIHARHELAGIIAEVSSQARRRAERDPMGDEILAALQELLDYHYGPAAKAVATREKNEAKSHEAPAAPPSKHPAAPPSKHPGTQPAAQPSAQPDAQPSKQAAAQPDTQSSTP